MPAAHTVAVLVREGVLPLELGLVHQLFSSARAPDGTALYAVHTCALDPGEVRTDADFSVRVDRGVDLLERAETVVVPASHDLDEPGRALSPPLADALRRVRPGTRLASICTGAFVLAEAGLLDGLRATTHWKSTETFRRAYPAVHLEPDVLYTDNGDVLTSAGEAAGIDLCLHLIRRDHGAAVAAEVARTTVVPPHRDGGQAQYLQVPVPPAAPHGSTAATRDWALRHLHRPLSLAELADHAAMSTRSFTRRFRQEVGLSPHQWLLRQRVERARQLLERTDLPVERVAAATGFSTTVSLRQHFARTLGVTPSRYRQTFRGSGHTSGRPRRVRNAAEL
ncbi:GlxA family transcriptional regulator [Saccharomonospora sp. NB11]|jgi:transcriptional regulator GlxA family with amidase domain|uniref:GlxA family transcriptional regulator n=1 Tax=Saccharomonospora sp. NB11 TaxID=1642298 RepID=UPI0018D04E57|nr:helix-turn-helix domain-containing protein [Saccharomonospora sp. NB11]